MYGKFVYLVINDRPLIGLFFSDCLACNAIVYAYTCHMVEEMCGFVKGPKIWKWSGTSVSQKDVAMAKLLFRSSYYFVLSIYIRNKYLFESFNVLFCFISILALWACCTFHTVLLERGDLCRTLAFWPRIRTLFGRSDSMFQCSEYVLYVLWWTHSERSKYLLTLNCMV